MVDIVITKFDYDRLMKLLDKKKPHTEFDKALVSELKRGKIIDSKDVPPEVVTMNSQILFADEHGDKWEYWLVFPEDADLASQKISILSPIGCALLGCSIGDEVTIPTPSGRRKLKVEEIIHQPEREGKFDL